MTASDPQETFTEVAAQSFKIVFESLIRYERVVFWFAFTLWLLSNLMLFLFPYIFPPDQRWSGLHTMTGTEKLTFSAWMFAAVIIFFTTLNLAGHMLQYILQIGSFSTRVLINYGRCT